MLTERENDSADLVARAVEEFFERSRRGEQPQLDEFVAKYPAIGELLATVIPGLQAAEQCVDVSHSDEVSHDQHRQLGDFRILRQIGRGGMGIVYEAEQISMNRRIALKVLPLAGLVDELKIRRFQNEVRAVAALNHPNIVPIYMVGEERGVHYFAMQLIRGRSLAEVISSLRSVHEEGREFDGSSISQSTCLSHRNALDGNDAGIVSAGTDLQHKADRESNGADGEANSSSIPHSSRGEYYRSVAALGIQAAKALQHAHDEGIIHRDIKPANLLLDRSAKLYVTDFGLARVESEAGVTMTGDVLGTLRYMAPEQALAKRVMVDHRADIYSLAVTLYELLALRPTYLAEDRQQLLNQIANEEPKRLRRVDRHIPTELETIIHKAMSKDVGQRYVSAQELADDLKSHLENRPIRAKPPSVSDIIGKWMRRNPALVWSAIAGLSLITITLAASAFLISRQRDDANQIAKRAQKERYVSDINLASHAWNRGDQKSTQKLLEMHRARAADKASFTSESLARNQSFAWRLLWGLSHADQLAWKLVPGISAVKCVAFSPNSNSMAYGSADGSVKIVDLLNDRHWQLRSLDSKVGQIAFSRDQRWLAAAGDNGKIRLWAVGAWQEVSDFKDHKGVIRDMLFHPDGNHLTSVDDEQIRIWDLEDIGAVSVIDHSLPSGKVISISADNAIAATYGGLSNTIQFWQLQRDPVKLKSLPSHQAMILSVVLASDGNTAFVSAYDGSLARWDLKTLRRTATYSQDVLAPRLALSLDGKVLVSTGVDNIIRIWEAESGRKLSTVRGYTGFQSGIAVATDATALAVLSRDGSLRVRSLKTKDSSDILSHKGLVTMLSVSPNGQTLATSDPHHRIVKLWDTTSGDLVGEFEGRQSIVFSPDGKWLALMSFEGQLQLWDTSTSPNRLQRIGDVGSFSIGNNLKFSNDSKLLAFSGKNETVTLWDVSKREVIYTLPNHEGSRPVAFGADDKVIATASSRLIRIWDVTSGQLVASMAAQDEEIRDICFSPNGKMLVATSGGHELDRWDVSDPAKPRQLTSLQGHSANIATVAFSPDGTLLATGGFDNALRLWDVALQRQLGVLRGHSAPIQTVAWSPDGNTIYSGSADASCRIWHAPSWIEIEASVARQNTNRRLSGKSSDINAADAKE